VGRTSLLLGLCVLAGAAWFWHERSDVTTGAPVLVNDSNATATDTQSNAAEVTGNASIKSPFSVENEASNSQTLPESLDPAADVLGAGSVSVDNQYTETSVQPAYSIDLASLGYSTLSDEELLQIADALRGDSALLQQLIDEFRQETNAERRVALSRILGEVGGDDVTLTASELIYSGDAESRRLGLELLQQVQPGNATARDIASSLLATEIEPTILVGTLTTLSKPGAVDDSTREYLSEQVAFMADHEDASVRSISLDILSRWSTDGTYTEVLRNGLTDQESVVREAAGYALVGHENVNQELIESLLAVAIDSTEGKRARSAAVLALSGMPINEDVRGQVTAAQRELNRVQR
jgi:hypothetical protein